MATLVNNPVGTLTEYELRHLVAHLAAAGRGEDVHRLLALETSEGRNAWYKAREQLGETAGFLADVSRAWRLADTQAAPEKEGIGLGIRYALIIVSINNMAATVPARLIEMAKREKLPPGQRRTHPRFTDRRRYESALTGLLPCLAELGHAEEALGMAEKIAFQVSRATALNELAPYLPELLRPQALTIARGITSPRWRVVALKGLVLHLPNAERLQLLQEILTVTLEIADVGERVDTLVELAPHFPESLLEQAVIAMDAGSITRQERAFRELYSVGREKYSNRSHSTIVGEAISAEYRRHALAELLPRWAELGHPAEALSIMREIENRWWQAEVLEKIAPYLSEPLLRQAFTIARGILLPRLAELGYPEEALTRAREIEDEWSRAIILTRLVPHLQEPERSQAVQEAQAAARAIEEAEGRAEALAGLVRHVPKAQGAEILHEALAAAWRIGDDRIFERMLDILYILQGELGYIEEALKDSSTRATVLVELAPHIPKRILPQVLASAQEMDGGERARVLAALAPYLPEPLLQQASASALEMANDWARQTALAGLVPRIAKLPHSDLVPLWQEMLPRLIHRNRASLLEDLSGLAPLIAASGGYSAVIETIYAIQDVLRWWS